MTPAALLLALANVSGPQPIVPVDPWNVASPVCETVEDLNPTGPLFDMVDWTTLDADLRATSHMASDVLDTPGPGGAPNVEKPGAYVLGTVVTQDRIVYLKTREGDTWDVNLIDDLGIWAWRTETNWNTPRSFTQFRRVGQILMAPRVGRGGFPGMRWINCDSAYASHAECGEPTRYGHLGFVIHELYGPYDYNPGWGDVCGPIMKLAYFYGCTAPESDSCTSVEVTWMSQRHGLFAWRLYEKKGGAWVQTGGGPPTVYLVPGVIVETFPCDGEMK